MIPIVTTDDAVRTLERIADLLDIRGDPPFKVRAYRQAAVRVASVVGPLNALLEEPQGLQRLDGVGAAIAAKLTELITTGRLGYLEDLEAEVPPTLLRIRDLPGAGPRTAAVLWHEANITTLDELAAAIAHGALEGIPRLGPRTVAKLERSVAEALERGPAVRRSREQVEARALGLCQVARSLPGVSRAEIAGSYRRGEATLGDLDIVAATEDGEEMLRSMACGAFVERVLVLGPTKCSVQVDGGFQVDCRAVSADSFGAAWLYFTGSKQHNIALRARALRRGLRLNEYGLHRLDDGVRLTVSTEHEIYGALGLEWIDPLLRGDAYDLQEATVTEHAATARAHDEV